MIFSSMPSGTRRHKVRKTLPAIAVICSGEGTNLQAILNTVKKRSLSARVAVVISDKENANALNRAKRAGVEARFINPSDYATREDFEKKIVAVLKSHSVKLVCLAGFMRILTPYFINAFSKRILNVHPALLPAFPGVRAIDDALGWGVKVTGVTVHFVDALIDHGPIILQEAVPIKPHDTKETLHSRIQKVEHRLYPTAISLVLEGRVRIKGRTVKIK